MRTTAVMILIAIVPLSGAILSRSTFEIWEDSLSEAGWIETTGGNGQHWGQVWTLGHSLTFAFLWV